MGPANIENAGGNTLRSYTVMSMLKTSNHFLHHLNHLLFGLR